MTLPKTDKIPCVRFDEAKKQVAEKYNREIRNPYDLEPEEEALIGQYYKEECDADFVFITHYPSKKRPFYAMDDPEDETYTLASTFCITDSRSPQVASVSTAIRSFLPRWRSVA